MIIREAKEADLQGLLHLYTQLHSNELPDNSKKLNALWQRILLDNNHHIVVAEVNGQIVSSCVIVIIPNLTHQQRPYALIENVVTAEPFRKKGLATACLGYAKAIASSQDCYKIMLLTGSKQDSTLNFYERAGYNKNDKTAFIMWL